MKLMKLKIGNKGFTLVEILAAIVILSITLIFFLPIFPKLVNWSNESQDELISSNLLSRIAEDVRKEPKIGEFLKGQIVSRCSLQEGYTDIPKESFSSNDKYKLNDKTPVIDLHICKHPTEDDFNLFRVKFEVTNNGRKSSSYTYYVN